MGESKHSQIEFTWGKRRGIGGKKKDVQFYESFTYDGDQYTLYDSVYLYKDGETEPFVGKIIKIWENADKSKKVKILWFFRPCEIQNFIGPNDASENELFLASGVGQGLANVNPLEAIAGKCNVICTSKDTRNVQPSDEDIQMADFIFYRTFDVGQRTILDKIVEKIAGIEVKYLFNQLGSERAVGISEVGFDKKQVCADAAQKKPVAAHSEKKSAMAEMNENSVDMFNDNGEFNHSFVDRSSAKETNSKSAAEVKEIAQSIVESLQQPQFKDNADCRGSFIEKEPFTGEESACKIGIESRRLVKNDPKDVIIKGKPFGGQEYASKVGVETRRLVKSGGKEETSLERNKSGSEVDFIDVKVNVNKKQEVDCVESVDGDNKEKSLKRRKLDVSSELSRKNEHSMQKSRSFHDCGDVETSIALSNKNNNSMQKSRSFHDREHVKTSTPCSSSTKEDSKHKHAKHTNEMEIPSKKIKLETKPAQAISNGKASKESPTTQNVDLGANFHSEEISCRLGVDRSKWFKGVPWEERIQDAHGQGRLVLLQNLNPSLTSAQVEEIIWDVFKERCSAKMIQRTAFSTPHSGKAYVILKSREAAENVVRKLHQGCLMANGRPLVGTIGQNPCLPEKKQTYYGHLVIDQIRLVQRETKDVVCTSHPSQPNNIEFDMAMEWCLLQGQAERALNKLYQRQQEEMRRLQAKLKSKWRLD